MKHKNLKIPTIILVIGLVVAMLAAMLTCIVKEPMVTEQDFNFTVTYELDGEEQTLEGIYRCRFRSVGKGTNPLERYYEGIYVTNPSEEHSAAYTIAEKDGLELCIVTIFSDRYLMGEREASFSYDPYLAVMDAEGIEYDDEEHLGVFDAAIVDWEYPQPVDNSFKFVGFSHLHDTSMIAMLVVGVLVIVACMILVKKDQTVLYTGIDKASVVLNFVVAIVAIPFITLVAALMQIYVSGDEFSYQLALCLPAITAFTVAASLSFRRNGFAKSGFLVQLIGPVLFALLILFE